MAKFFSSNYDETALLAGVDRFEKQVLEKLLFSGAAAAASVIYQEVKLNAEPPRINIKTGALHGAIYWVHSPEQSTDKLKTYKISWNRRKAPHGHLIEFGTSRAPAHPFVRPAFDHIGRAMQDGTARMGVRYRELTA